MITLNKFVLSQEESDQLKFSLQKLIIKRELEDQKLESSIEMKSIIDELNRLVGVIKAEQNEKIKETHFKVAQNTYDLLVRELKIYAKIKQQIDN